MREGGNGEGKDSYVETLFSLEILSQKSPSLTV